ncbi:MAG: A/G-specific adenine glycosylase [Nitriliruptorales bacterium]|nr:A/G-specific adenine glycosylase [Nitriliruptorales bacterium]
MTRGFRQELLAWGERVRRDLPWRQTRDPWAILVSEVMLQQTQVARVVPKYERFLERFPDVQSCAAAPVAAVIELWDGLGYNRRAVHLHRSAVAMLERHGGEVPSSLDELLALPGVGPYTARAVLTFAFEEQVGILDTNTGRIASRALAGRPLGRAEAQELLDAEVPADAAWAWNQALLDLGATVCSKRDPDCGGCPVASSCRWHRSGSPRPDPAHGSAGVSTTQPPFEGSLRQARGRLVAALRNGPVAMEAVAAAAGTPSDPDRAQRAAEGLVRDGVATIEQDRLRLPGS